MSRRRTPLQTRCRAWALAGCALVTPASALGAEAGTANARSSGSGVFEARIEAPEGFGDLTGDRDLLVDLYVGGRRAGEVRVTASGRSVRFQDPRSVATLIPNLADPQALTAALETDLAANAALVCSALRTTNCGRLEPEQVGVIFDEERFRLDLFLAPHLLSTQSRIASGYLDAPESGLSLANSFAFSLSGGNGQQSYQLQARNIIGLRNGRLRSNAVLASRQGLLIDDLVAEIDRPGWRYSGGLFWAPGSDFTGRRRMLGVGVSTQLDTRIDREALQGSPLFLFLQQPARVEILVDGRLVGSGFYEAGNNLLDTSTLPTGSYPLELRIREGGGAPRIERRFFVRSTQMAPLGHPQYFAFAGVMADTRKGRPLSFTNIPYVRAGTARRISRSLGLEGAVTGTRGKVLGEAGAVLATRYATVRAVGLYSSAGDTGLIAQLSSGDLGPVSFSWDLRRIHTADDEPLLPSPSGVDSLSGSQPTAAQASGGRYTQITGTAGLNLGALNLQLLGFFRSDKGVGSSYSIGPSVNWRLIGLPGMQLTLSADAQKTSTGTAAFVGARLLVTRGGFSVASTAGSAWRSGSDGRGISGVGSVSGQWYRQFDEQTELNLLAGLDRTSDSMSGQAGASLQSRFGSARADLVHRFGSDSGAGTEYIVNMQSGGAVTSGAMKLGGRKLDESAIIATVAGEGGPFELLVDDVPQGRIAANSSLPLFLRPYRSYQVRLRAVGERASDYDSGARSVTLYPGSVAHVMWRAEPVVTLFGRALDAAGNPVASALVEARRGSGQTDDEGWFQVDVSGDKELRFTRDDGSSCRVELKPAEGNKDYVRVGDVTCQ